MKKESVTKSSVNGGKAQSGKSISQLHLFYEGEEEHCNISTAMKGTFELKKQKDWKRVLTSLPLHEETTSMSLLGKESMAEATSCLPVSILPFFLRHILYSVNRLYFPVSCAAWHGHMSKFWPERYKLKCCMEICEKADKKKLIPLED